MERRNIRARQVAFAAEMSRPFAERRCRSWDRLVQTVRFAGATVPYYRDLFSSIGFDPDRLIRDPGYLSEIPSLTKDIIREQGDRMLRDDHAGYRKHVCKTGGSTGPSTNIIYDQRGADWSSAVTRHARSLVGAGASRSEVHLSAEFGEPIPIKDRIREQIKCLANNRFNLTFATFAPAELDIVWQRIMRIRPFLVHGHPSTLYQLAVQLEARGFEAVHGRAFEVFESSGEVLSAAQRELISRVFGCRVVNRYGLAEAGVVAYQVDRKGDDMTVFDPVAWPEIMDVDFSAELSHTGDGRVGELVVTTLANRMMPLVRYCTGDIASLRETPDGFELRKVVGRVHDVVELAGIPVPTHHVQDVLDRIGGVREFQIERRQNRLMFRIVPESLACRKSIELGLHKRWKNSIDVEFVGMDALKRQGWRSKFRHLVPPVPAE
jgi:phenylacetate-CoA ligase